MSALSLLGFPVDLRLADHPAREAAQAPRRNMRDRIAHGYFDIKLDLAWAMWRGTPCGRRCRNS